MFCEFSKKRKKQVFATIVNSTEITEDDCRSGACGPVSDTLAVPLHLYWLTSPMEAITLGLMPPRSHVNLTKILLIAVTDKLRSPWSTVWIGGVKYLKGNGDHYRRILQRLKLPCMSVY